MRAAIVFQSGEYFQGQFGQPPESEYANSALSELGIMWARALSKLPARASLTYILSLIAVFLIWSLMWIFHSTESVEFNTHGVSAKNELETHTLRKQYDAECGNKYEYVNFESVNCLSGIQ